LRNHEIIVELVIKKGAKKMSLWIPAGVVIVGFIAAVTIGSIAWYNSKRPPGWEDAERPKYVPKVGKDEENS
jgi:hypothetical protein